jgi:hypothetical protein
MKGIGARSLKGEGDKLGNYPVLSPSK